MSLSPAPIDPIPKQTIRVAQAAFPKGNPYMTFRDEMGVIFHDDDFVHLYSQEGQPGLAPWRLAWVTIMQFRETLPDRQAAEAVRARIDWKYLLGLELTDPGFDFSVLSEFRDRLLAGNAENLLLDKLLEQCRTQGLIKARGQQRTDSTHVLAAIRVLNRLELVAETLRAALNELATVAPEWLRELAPLEWFERYKRRIEDARLPKDKAAREAYAQTVGEDGFCVLDALAAPETPEVLRLLPRVEALRQAWQRHYERSAADGGNTGEGTAQQVIFKPKDDLPPAAQGLESPYDPAARYRNKGDTQWVGYMAHLSETCDPDEVHLITHTHTTAATVHEAVCTDDIEQALVDKDLPPQDHLVDAAYISAELLVQSQAEHGISLIGPPRPDSSWQSKVEGAYSTEHFTIDWDEQQVHCPPGKASVSWTTHEDVAGHPYIRVGFSPQDCGACEDRGLCTRAQPPQARTLKLQPQAQYEALQVARARVGSEAWSTIYATRAGIEGTVSQGVRGFGLRRTRYRGLEKTHLQNVAISAAINVDRLVAWFDGRPRAQTRLSRFAALAPERPPGTG
ncbi:MAG: IS1182 family transposase [Candidatus Tectomicrobia bacterium]